MPHDTALIATVAAAFALAFLFGFGASRLALPPLVGYLVAGVVLGVLAPVVNADVGLAGQLAELGVVLLMFGIGLHVSVPDLLAVRRVALPGAVAQVAAASAIGAALARGWGWGWGAALVFGLALSVSSTVVVLRTLDDRGMLDSAHGRTAVGWLVVQDLVMVLALVLLPAAAASLGGAVPADRVTTDAPPWQQLAVALGKILAFLGTMYVAGRRAVPGLLTRVARTGSRELFTLALLALALGIAVGAAALFGVSLALGAFFAGVVISESDLSYKAAADALPLQDAFAVLFFVSVGMLFDPVIVVRRPLAVLATVLAIVVGNAVVTAAVLVALRHPVRPALRLGAAFGQVGEFSFVLAGLGVGLGLLPAEGRSLILAAALITMTGNSFLVSATAPLDRWLERRPAVLDRLERPHAGVPAVPEEAAGGSAAWAPPREHVVLVGYGRVGRTVGAALERAEIPFVVIEQDLRTVEQLRRRGVPVVYGDASRPGILAHARPDRARLLVVAAPDPYHALRILELARGANPGIDTVVRTHRDDEQALFERLGVGRAVMGEHELAVGMTDYALRAMGHGGDGAPRPGGGEAPSAPRAERAPAAGR